MERAWKTGKISCANDAAAAYRFAPFRIHLSAKFGTYTVKLAKYNICISVITVAAGRSWCPHAKR